MIDQVEGRMGGGRGYKFIRHINNNCLFDLLIARIREKEKGDK